MMIRYAAAALFLSTLSILAVSDELADGGDFIKLPSEARRFFDGDGAEDGDSIGTRWAILLAGSNGYWNYRHQVIASALLFWGVVVSVCEFCLVLVMIRWILLIDDLNLLSEHGIRVPGAFFLQLRAV